MQKCMSAEKTLQRDMRKIYLAGTMLNVHST